MTLSANLPPINDVIDVSTAPFTLDELKIVIRRMGSKKATQEDDIPVECFKALCNFGDIYLDWLFALCS